MKRVLYFSVFLTAFSLLSSTLYSQEYIANHLIAKEEVLRSIPREYIDKARSELVIAYQHTSHGTHVTRGMYGLPLYKAGDDELFGISESAEANKLEFRDLALQNYAPPGITAIDLSVDETAFIQTTRNYLDAPENSTVNVIMWSWCNIAGHDVAGNYLPGLDLLISEYGEGGTMIGTGVGQREVSVSFIRMTGHANVNYNTGPLNPKEQADTINSYSIAHQQYCLDYYYIDTHDMDDNYWEDAGDDGNSASYGGNFYHDYQDAHTVGDGYYENRLTPGGAVIFGAHTTQHITSNRKAYAMWWILARIAGYQGLDPVTGITVDAEGDSLVIATDGGTLQMIASIEPVDASIQTLSWTVINGTGIASIDSTGLLRAISDGTVKVRATARDGSGVYGEADIAISEQLIRVSEIEISYEGDSALINTNNGTLQLQASVLPVEAASEVVSWSVLPGTGKAFIDANGLVSALSNGTVRARATATDGSGIHKEQLISITNQRRSAITEIVLSGEDGVAVIASDSGMLQLSARVLPSDAIETGLSWSVTNGTGAASIDSTGLLTAQSEGVVVARATAMDSSAVFGEMEVTITNLLIPLSEIVISHDGDTALIDVNDGTLQLGVSVLPANATDTRVLWSVTDQTGSASIDADGLLSALGNGTIRVRATALDGSEIYADLIVNIINQLEEAEVAVSAEGGVSSIETDGGSLQMLATVSPVDTTLSWMVINGTGIASIDTTALLTAISNGTVTVRATAMDGSGLYGEALITISGQLIRVSEINIGYEGDSAYVDTDDGTFQLLASVLPADAANPGVAWSVLPGTGKAYINASGLLSAQTDGTVLARATATDGSGVYAEQEVRISDQVIQISEITVSGENALCYIDIDGGSRQMSAAILPLDAADTTVSWSVINGTGEASVDSTGLVTALSNGTAMVRATANDSHGVYGEMQIILTNQIVLVSDIFLSGEGGSNRILSDSGMLQLHATVLPENATRQGVSWSITNGTGTASIDSTGLVRAHSFGTVTALAAALDSSGVFGELELTILDAADTLTLGVDPQNPQAVYTNISVSDSRRAMQVTLPEPGLIQTVSIYHQGGSGGLMLGVYSDDSGSPGTRLGLAPVTQLSSSEGWQELSLIDPVAAGGGEVLWLAWVFENNPGIRYAAGTPGRAASSDTWSGGLPSDFGSSSQASYTYSIFASYTSLVVSNVPPEAPTNLNILASSSSSVSLSWEDNSYTETGFELERSDSSGTAYILLHSIAANESSYQDLSVDPEQTYYYRVRAINDFGGSDYSSEVSASTPAEPVGGIHFGYETVYINTSVSINRRAMQVTMPEQGFVQSVTIYHMGGSGGLMLGVYGDDSGSPGTRLGLTPVTQLNSTEGWQEVHLSTPLSVAGGEAIWLAWIFEDNPGIRYDSGTPGRASSPDTWSAGMPADFGSSSQSSLLYSIYASYTSSVVADTIPAAPTNLSLLATTPFIVSLGWEDNSFNETGFELERSDSSGTAYVLLHTTGAGVSSYEDSTVLPEHSYYYRLRSANAIGESDYTSELSVNTPAEAVVDTVPFAPTNLSILTSTTSSVSLSWEDASLNETGFELERSDSSGTAYVSLHTTGAGVSSYEDLSVDPEQTYYYRVRAINTYGASDYTPEVSVSTPAVPVGGFHIGYETIYAHTSVSGSRRAMQVTMPEQGQIQSVSIYHMGGFGGLLLGVYSDNGGSPGARLGITPEVQLNPLEGWQEVHLSAPLAVAGGEVLWLAWVFQSNPGIRYDSGTPGRASSSQTWPAGMPSDFGSSSQSNLLYSIYASYSTAAVIDTIPEAPTNLSMLASTFSSVSLGWEDNSYNETGFELERSDSTGTGYLSLFTTGDNITSYEDLSVEPEHTYFYRIRSINTIGESDFTSELRVSTPAEPVLDTLPLAPTNMSILSSSASSVSLGWEDNSINETGFELQRSDSPGSGYVSLFTTGLNVNSFQDLTVEPEHTYYYRVRAINTYGESDYAAEVSVSTPAVPVGGTPFGYETIYANISVSGSRRAMQVTMPEQGLIQSLTIYHMGGNGGLLLGVYEDDAGRPGARLGTSAITELSPTEGWQELQLSTPLAVAGGEVLWLAWVFQNNPGIRYDSGTPGRASSSETWPSGLPADFGSSSQSNLLYSIYASYTSLVVSDTVPEAPSNLSLVSASAFNVSLSWEDNSYNETGFELERSDNPGSGYAPLINTGVNVNSYDDLTVDPEQSYYYRVRSINAFGDSEYTSELSVSTPAVPVGGIPFGFDGIYEHTSTTLSRRAMQVTMPEQGLIQSVTIYHAGGSGGLMLGVYGDDGGRPGARLGLTTVTPLSSSEGWQEVNLNTPVSAAGGEVLWLAWVFENNPGIRFESGTPGRASSSDDWSGGMPSDFGSSSQSNFIYSIYASYTIAPPAFTIETTVIENITLGTEAEEELKIELLVYPNPTMGEVTISWEHSYSSACLLNIYSSSGRIMKNLEIEAERKEVQLNISDYPPGIYIITLIDLSKKQERSVSRLLKL